MVGFSKLGTLTEEESKSLLAGLDKNPQSELRSIRIYFEHSDMGFFHAKTILDDQSTPIDWEYIDVNHAFVKMTGLSRDNCVGKRMSETFPGLTSQPSDLLRRFCKVALTGMKDKFNDYSESLEKWFEVQVFSPSYGEFGVTFSDITERKLLETENEKLKEKLKSFTSRIDAISGLLPVCSVCNKVKEKDGSWQHLESYLRDHVNMDFTHGYCPDCYTDVLKDFKLNNMEQK